VKRQTSEELLGHFFDSLGAGTMKKRLRQEQVSLVAITALKVPSWAAGVHSSRIGLMGERS
jgi:hypothetical protein